MLALPADRVLTTEDRVELARSFAAEHFVSKGLAVQLDVHAPHRDRGEGEGAWADGTGGDHTNWHAHLLITTRRIEGDQLSAKKARDLDPEVRRAGTRALVTDAEAWGETWRAHQDRYFLEHGIALRVDATAAYPGEHIGPVRMRRVGSPAVERAEVLRQSNEAAARDPEQVLAALTRNNATFTERELDRYLAKHLGTGPDGTPDPMAAADIAAAKAAVMKHPTVLALHDKETGAQAERFTTTTVRAQEREALADGAAVAGARHHQGVKPPQHQERTGCWPVAHPAGGSAHRVRARGGCRRAEADRGPGRHGEELHAGGGAGSPRGGGLPYRGIGPYQRRGAGPEGGRVHGSGHGPRRPVRHQERPQPGVGPAHGAGGGRGGHAGQPRHRRAAGGSQAGRRQGDPDRRRPAARQHRAGRAVHRAAACARGGRDHRGDAAAGGLAAPGGARLWPRAGSTRRCRRSSGTAR